MADGTQKAPKGWLIAGLICLALGIAGCGAAGTTVAGLAGMVDDIRETARFGETVRVTALSDNGGIALLTAPGDCSGTDGSGRMVEFSSVDSFTLDTDGQEFRHGFTFDTSAQETYEIQCGSSDASGDFAVVPVPSLIGGIGIGVAFAVTGIGFIAGGLFLLVGTIFVIVGLVQRSKWKKSRGPGAPGSGQGVPYGAVPGGALPYPGSPQYPGTEQHPGSSQYPGSPQYPGAEQYPGAAPTPPGTPPGFPPSSPDPSGPPTYQPPVQPGPPAYQPPPSAPAPPYTPPDGGPDEPAQTPPPYPPPPPPPPPG